MLAKHESPGLLELEESPSSLICHLRNGCDELHAQPRATDSIHLCVT